MKRFIIFITTLMFTLCAGLGLCFEASAATQHEMIFRDSVNVVSDRYSQLSITIKAYDDGIIEVVGAVFEKGSYNEQGYSYSDSVGNVGSFCFNDFYISLYKTDMNYFQRIESYENNLMKYTISTSHSGSNYVGSQFSITLKVNETWRTNSHEMIFFGKEISIPFGAEPVVPFDNTEYEQLKSANAALAEQNSLLSAEKDYLSSQLQEAKDEITILNADLASYKAIAQALTEAANQKTEEIRLLRINQEELETKIKQLTNNPDNADFNNDGKITVADAVYFLVYLANKPSTMVEWIE